MEFVEIRPGRVIHILDAAPTKETGTPATSAPGTPTLLTSSGEKPIILFIHGSCSRMGHLEYQVRHFVKAGYHVVAFDMLGCGKSARPTDQSYGLKAHMLDLLEILELVRRRYTSDIVLVGHSAGANLAMTVGTLALPRVLACVAIAPVAINMYESFDFRLSWFFSLPSAVLWLIRPVTHFLLRKTFFGSKATRQLIALESEASSLNAVHVYKSYYSRTNYTELKITEHHRLRHPLLIIGASDDRVTPFSGCVDNYQFFLEHKDENVTVELAEIPDTGHCLCSEDPESVNSVMENFIRSTIPNKAL